MITNKTKLLVIVSFLLLAGCASQLPQPEFEKMAAAHSDLKRSPSGYSIKIHDVAGGQDTDIWKGSRINGESFLKALAVSIDHNGYFTLVGPQDPSDFIIAARIIDQKQPTMGLDISVGLTVDYGLFDSNKEVVWEDRISNEFTAKISDELIGYKRLDLANEGVVRENIKAALSTIYGLNI